VLVKQGDGGLETLNIIFLNKKKVNKDMLLEAFCSLLFFKNLCFWEVLAWKVFSCLEYKKKGLKVRSNILPPLS
jgi:hypothetical protein